MPSVDMREICKYYPESGVKANDYVDLSVKKTEIHAIVGENGAGKTTLMNILYGLERADSGRICLDGEEVVIRNPRDAVRLGIGMVHQHFKLIRPFTIAENVTLAMEQRKYGVLLDRREAWKATEKVIADFGFDLDPGAKIADLTAGQMQQVEIVKILYRHADVLILDEPTSVLAEQQIRTLFDTLKNLTCLGKTIIIISHKLDEVMSIADRVTVMRKGKSTAVRNTDEVDDKELSRLMIGKGITYGFKRDASVPGEPVLALYNVSVAERTGHRPLLDNVSFSVRAGEIVGLTGVAGNGLEELEEVVNGLRKVDSGRIEHRGLDVTNASSYFLREQGMAYVPSDRLRRGSSLSSSVLENLIITSRRSFLNRGFFRRKAMEKFGREILKHYSIDTDLYVPMGTLSGGSIQKIILSRELSAQSDFIMFSDPTWGLDVASAEYIYSRILECRRSRAAILLISNDLDEVLGLSDRLMVMHRGKVVGVFENDGTLSKETIGEYILGLRNDFKGDAGNDGQATMGRGDGNGGGIDDNVVGGGSSRDCSDLSPE
ncbi:MAG: ABC transporter ATP-binding protein [Spirochaetales bacterium]|nr:ABC transporter ATP-binding protein [Spirochaetales bacterium]